MKRKQKCKVCGNRFNVSRENTYQVTESITMVKAFSETAKTFDAIDCPMCGCQCLLAERLFAISSAKQKECEESHNE